MNKYQEALDNLYRRSTDAHFYIPMGEDKLWKNTLQELIDKATPLLDKETSKKVIIINHSKIGHSYATHCPNCNERVIWEDKRCLECGQKLDWGDE